MDAAQSLTAALGVVVVLAGFWAFIGSQFVRKDVSAEQSRRIDDKLSDISMAIAALSQKMDGAIVKSTIDELANKLAELHMGERLPIRRGGRGGGNGDIG